MIGRFLQYDPVTIKLTITGTLAVIGLYWTLRHQYQPAHLYNPAEPVNRKCGTFWPFRYTHKGAHRRVVK